MHASTFVHRTARATSRFFARNLTAALVITGLAVLTAPHLHAQADIVKAKAVSEVAAAEVGQPFMVGMLLDINPQWHVYWSTPGESGFATEMTIKSKTPGVTVQPTLYPAPMRFESPGPLTSYGYGEQVLLMAIVDIEKVAPDAKTIDLEIAGKWLMCADRCIPGKAALTLSVPVGGADAGKRGKDEALFAKYKALVPGPASSGPDGVKVASTRDKNTQTVTVTIAASADNAILATGKWPENHELGLYPMSEDDYEMSVPKITGTPTTVTSGADEYQVYENPVTITYTIKPIEDANTKPAAAQSVLALQRYKGGKLEKPSLVTLKP